MTHITAERYRQVYDQIVRTVIIYDSFYGNTEIIAKAIGENISGFTTVLRINEVNTDKLRTTDLIVVGSPVHGGRPTPAIEEFLMNLPADFLSGVKVAAFDTRFASEDHGFGLKVLMGIIRFAAERMSKLLVKKGGTLASQPQGFIVSDKRGPLRRGEIERARKWGRELSVI